MKVTIHIVCVVKFKCPISYGENRSILKRASLPSEVESVRSGQTSLRATSRRRSCVLQRANERVTTSSEAKERREPTDRPTDRALHFFLTSDADAFALL